MIFYNTTDRYIFLTIDASRYELEPNKMVNIEGCDCVKVTIKHDYPSKALSEAEIISDDIDASVVSLVTAAHKKPYFEIVLDCSYFIKGTNESKVYIRKEKIRPNYFCSYDRLYPELEDGCVEVLNYSFIERKKFENHYQSAISSSNRKIVLILIIVLFLFSLPILCLCFLSKILFGIIALLLITIFLSIVWLGSMAVIKLINRADCLFVTSNFDSKKIMKAFNNPNNK